MLRWLKWHLDRFATVDAEMRLLDHAARWSEPGIRSRRGGPDGCHGPGLGRDAAGRQPPPDLQKTGGLQGIFSYVAFAPSRGIGVFVAINQFNIAGVSAMAQAANELISELAPR
jgi:D-alanyl-D-alanine-carboxypeptidase/D-alanyl-D-alanine-endopeptidase